MNINKLAEVQEEIRELYDNISDLSEKNFAIYKEIGILYDTMYSNNDQINRLKNRLGKIDMEATKLLTEKKNENAI